MGRDGEQAPAVGDQRLLEPCPPALPAVVGDPPPGGSSQAEAIVSELLEDGCRPGPAGSARLEQLLLSTDARAGRRSSLTSVSADSKHSPCATTE